MYIKKILWAIALIGLVICGIIAYYIYGAMFESNTAFNNEIAYIYVPTNANYAEVRSQLEPLLKDIDTFDALANQKQYTSNIKAGRFAIRKGMNNNDIINSIRSKNLPLQIAFNNQHSLMDLAGRISTQIEADSITLYSAMTSATFLKENNFSKATALGMYLPNSYQFFWNTSAEGFRDKMLNEYNRFWTDARKAKAKILNLTPNEVITLASIVHEESKKSVEQPRV
ncbi:MAG: endolytic transglycosylase MltG, partial [Winogradskyella sp.]|nr:endolytic transglycosylase MltG [Winogradskyella sp.]